MPYGIQRSEEDYRELLDYPYHGVSNHPHMNQGDRAAQFAPFAALTGYEALVEETARTVERQPELNEETRQELNRRLQFLLIEQAAAVFTFFVPDGRKEGGSVETAEGILKKADPVLGTVTLHSGKEIPLEFLLDIGSTVFDEWKSEE